MLESQSHILTFTFSGSVFKHRKLSVLLLEYINSYRLLKKLIGTNNAYPALGRIISQFSFNANNSKITVYRDQIEVDADLRAL